MDNKITCDICSSSDIKIVYYAHMKENESKNAYYYTISNPKPKKPEKIAKCKNCSLMFVPRNIGNYGILKDYENYVDGGYLEEEKGRRRSAQILLKRIEAFMKEGRMLEIGCANGFFLDEARKRGWKIAGIEPSRWACEYAEQKLDIKIFAPTLEESTFEKETFDAVVMLDVIEHLESPRKTLLIINKILNKDGILVVTTPDVESFLSRLLRARWWGINRYHLFYFSKNTLEDFFKRTGFYTLCHKSHVRIFTCRYWFKRVSSYLPSIRPLAKSFFGMRRFARQNIKISFYDQIEVYAKKI